jgi:hypothetical protein
LKEVYSTFFLCISIESQGLFSVIEFTYQNNYLVFFLSSLVTQSFKLLLKVIYFSILPVDWFDFVKKPETEVASCNGNMENYYQVYSFGEHQLYAGELD